VVGAFPDSNSALMLVCARLRYMESSLWGTKCYLNMKHLQNFDWKEEVDTDSTASCRPVPSEKSNVRIILDTTVTDEYTV